MVYQQPSFDQQVWYFINSLLAVLPPVFIYHSIYGLLVTEAFVLYGIISIFAAVALTFSYNNSTQVLFNRLWNQRDEIITQNIVGLATGKKDKAVVDSARKEHKTNTENESISFSILYNNLFFLSLYIIVAFFVVPNLAGNLNYAVSVIASSVIVFYVSNSALKSKY